MQHLDMDTQMAINRLKSILLTKKIIHEGVFNSIRGFFTTSNVLNVSVTRTKDDGIYSETISNISLVIEHTTVKTNMVSVREIQKSKLDLVVLPAFEDNAFPEMLEVKMFGKWGKPSTVGIDRNDGNIYLIYIVEDELYFLQFAQLSKIDSEFITSQDNISVTYEFGIARKALYGFITREFGWNNLRENMFIRFNTSPFVRIDVGSKPEDEE